MEQRMAELIKKIKDTEYTLEYKNCSAGSEVHMIHSIKKWKAELASLISAKRDEILDSLDTLDKIEQGVA